MPDEIEGFPMNKQRREAISNIESAESELGNDF